MKRTLIVSLSTAGLVILTGCGNNSDNSNDSSADKATSGMSDMTMSSGASSAGAPTKMGTPAAGPHNTQDVSFATDMIPHHMQAVTMAEMALTKASTPEVKRLATAIKSAQAPEIAAMSGWLAGWHQPIPSGSDPMHHTGGMAMPGMMSSADMAALNKATGTAFDKLWLTRMIGHHQGAVTMARTELAKGRNGDAKTLAQSIITSQSNEITQMTRLLPAVGK